MKPSSLHRRLTAILSLVAWAMAGAPAFAQDPVSAPSFLLRPHCEEADVQNCPAFEAESPETIRTDLLNVGDTLDMDIVLHNPDAKAIRRVRTWLSYDSEQLEGVSITPGSKLPLVVPGESDFAPEQGYAKIGLAAQEPLEPTDTDIIIARVIFRVRTSSASGRAPISFYNQKPDNTGHTYALATDTQNVNIITGPLGSLVVRIESDATTSSAASSTTTSDAESDSSESEASVSSIANSSSAASQASSSATGSGIVLPGASFGALQVQNVRITTERSNIYVAWTELRTPRVQGYNVYYGSQMGRYLQRRSLPKTATTITLRDLPEGTRYYVSVRAVSDTNEETAFSQEVGVEVGNPRTATAPLLNIPGSLNGDVTAPQNPLGTPGQSSTPSVPGQSGFSSTFAMLIAACAVIGTGFAFRRQCIALTTAHHV